MAKGTCVYFGCGRPFVREPRDQGRCPGHRRPANVHSNPRRGTAAYEALRRAVFERDGYTCRYCGAGLQRTPDGVGRPPELEHRVPRTAGGEDTLENCLAACRPCNRRKGARGAP